MNCSLVRKCSKSLGFSDFLMESHASSASGPAGMRRCGPARNDIARRAQRTLSVVDGTCGAKSRILSIDASPGPPIGSGVSQRPAMPRRAGRCFLVRYGIFELVMQRNA